MQDFSKNPLQNSFSDLLIAVFGIPMDFTAALHFGWKMGEGLCVFTGFALTFLGNTFTNQNQNLSSASTASLDTEEMSGLLGNDCLLIKSVRNSSIKI